MSITQAPRLPVLEWRSFSGEFHSDVPCLLDRPNLLYTTSGRAALFLALKSMGVGVGDEILVPSYHCPTMVSPVVALGAAPLFYGLDADGSPRLDDPGLPPLERVRALIAPHYFGLPARMSWIRNWCSARGILLIEDCAHAMFGVSGDRAIGAWGDVAIGSLTKFFPLPEGGCLIRATPGSLPGLQPRSTKDEIRTALNVVHEGARFGRLWGANGLVKGLFDLRRMLRRAPAEVPAGDSMTAHAAAATAPEDGEGLSVDTLAAERALTRAAQFVACHMPRSEIVAARRANYLAFLEAFAGQRGLRPLWPSLPSGAVPYVFPLWVDHPDPGYGKLRREGIPMSRWNWLWPGVPRRDGDWGVRFAHHVLQVPCHQALSPADRNLLIDRLRASYST